MTESKSLQSAPNSPSGGGSPEADLELVRAHLQGSEEARQELERRLKCIPAFLSYRNRGRGTPFQPEELQDIAQDVFVLIWKRIDRFEGRAKLEAWAYRICALEFQNAVRRKIRQKALTKELGPDTHLDAMSENAPTPAEDRLEGLRLAMGSLPAEEGRILDLKFHEKLSFEQIGERLGLTASGAKYHYYRTLEHLRKLMKGVEGEE